MDKRPMKTVGESRTEQLQIVLPGHSNGDGRLFGGRLMEWIYVVAAVVALRHSGVNVTTAAVDNLQFKAAAHIGEPVLLVGQMTRTGNTSMEVRVEVYVEHPVSYTHLDIGLEVGYHSASSFGRQFRAVCVCTPKAYRLKR